MDIWFHGMCFVPCLFFRESNKYTIEIHISYGHFRSENRFKFFFSLFSFSVFNVEIRKDANMGLFLLFYFIIRSFFSSTVISRLYFLYKFQFVFLIGWTWSIDFLLVENSTNKLEILCDFSSEFSHIFASN